MTWIAETSAIAVGIAAGVELTRIGRTLRTAIGGRLYAYAVRLRDEQASRRAGARVVAITETDDDA